MAAIIFALQSANSAAPIKNYSGPLVSATWAGLLNDATPGQALQNANFILNSLQIVGTFGVGGSVSLYGSNDGTNFVILPDINNNPATLTSAGIIFFKESPIWIRPAVTAGDGTTLLTAIASLRKQVVGG